MCDIPIELKKVTKHLHGLPKKRGIDLESIANELFNRFKIKVAHSTLQRYLNPDDDLKLPADLVPFLCIVLDDFSICTYIKNTAIKENISISTIARLTKEAGEAITELAKAIDPQGIGGANITREERQRCINELIDLKDIVNAILATLIN